MRLLLFLVLSTVLALLYSSPSDFVCFVSFILSLLFLLPSIPHCSHSLPTPLPLSSVPPYLLFSYCSFSSSSSSSSLSSSSLSFLSSSLFLLLLLPHSRLWLLCSDHSRAEQALHDGRNTVLDGSRGGHKEAVRSKGRHLVSWDHGHRDGRRRATVPQREST